jgi:hypothetical protein
MTVKMNAYFLEPKSIQILCFSVITVYLEISNLCELATERLMPMSEFNVALLMLDKKIGHNSLITNYKISAEDDIYD